MESFLTKAMKKLNPVKNDVVPTPKDETTKANEDTTIIPTNKAKLRYKQQTLSNIASGGMQNNGKQLE